MKNKKRLRLLFLKDAFKSIPITVLMISMLIFSGCNKEEDNSIMNPTQTSSSIKGRVVDYWGKGVGNVKVETASGITKTSADGSFTLQSLIFPYNISVYSDFYGNVETFNYLTTSNPNLAIDVSNVTKANKSDIMVIIPQYNSNQRAQAIFYSDSGYYKSQHDFWGSYYGVLTHNWNGSSVIQGKMALWIYTIDNQGKISSFDKYGEKPMTITNGLNSRVVFNDVDLSTNPSDSTITGTISTEPNYQIQIAGLGMNRYSFANIYNYGSPYWLSSNTNTGFSVFSPVLSGNIYKYYMYIGISGNNQGMGTKVAEVKPNTDNVITFNIFPTLISPADNDENVNYDTPFTFSKDYPNGIYKLSFSYTKPNGFTVNRDIYTNSESYKLDILSDTSFKMTDNMLCHWYVAKITGFQSVEEFLSIPPALNPKFKEILYSAPRYFKTKLTKAK